MRGLFSAAPGPLAIRLMVGTHLLLLIQAALVLWSAPDLALQLRVLVALVFALALASLGMAIHGGSESKHPYWWRRRHGRK